MIAWPDFIAWQIITFFAGMCVCAAAVWWRENSLPTLTYVATMPPIVAPDDPIAPDSIGSLPIRWVIDDNGELTYAIEISPIGYWVGEA